MKTARTFARTLALLTIVLSCFDAEPVAAEYAVEVPALAVANAGREEVGVFTVKLIWWDQKPEPDPVRLQWGNGFINAFEYGRITPGGWDRSATVQAFRYAVAQTPQVRHTGTVTVQGVAYGSTTMDGPSAGAAMAIGFIAVFRQDPIKRGVALTGSLQPHGRVGPVGGLSAKVRAAAREGFHTILVPAGQLADPRSPLAGLALELNVTITEVSTIEEAYPLMTGGGL